MAMLCVIGWLFPGLAPLWLLLPEPVAGLTNGFAAGKKNQPLVGVRKTARRIRSPCFQGIWKGLGVRLEGG